MCGFGVVFGFGLVYYLVFSYTRRFNTSSDVDHSLESSSTHLSFTHNCTNAIYDGWVEMGGEAAAHADSD